MELRICFKNLKPCPFTIEEKPKTAFVFMPFRDELQEVYTSGIKETLEELGWTCHRSDEKFDTPEIVCTICKGAQEASLIIADLTGRNPNVFLEVGLAFGLEKYVALLSQNSQDIPFDTRTFRAIMYNPHNPLNLKQRIRTLARTIKAPPKLHKESPEATIEIARRRREHSSRLKDEVLKPWLSKVGEYCKIGVTYSYEVHKIVGLEPKDPIDLKFFDFAKSHLESKYPEIMKAWEELKLVTSKHNKDLASLLEETRTLTIKDLKIPAYYSDMRGRLPEEHITLDRFVEAIYQEMNYRIRTRAQERAEHRVHPERKWMIGKPLIQPVMHGKEKFHTLAWGSYRLVRNRDEEKVKKAKSLIDKILDTSRFKDEVKNLIDREDQIYKTKRDNFETKIKDVINSVELGNVLEGRCRFCEQWEK